MLCLFFFFEFILYSAMLGHDSPCPDPTGHRGARPDGVFSSPHYPPDCKRKNNPESNTESNIERTSHTLQIPRPRRLARPVLDLIFILTVLSRCGPADIRAYQEVQYSWAAPFLNKELGYEGLPFPLLGLPPDFCPQDGLLRIPRPAALEQMLARLLNSAVAPPTGVAGALAKLLEVRPDGCCTVSCGQTLSM